jgi:lysophospholipase
MKRPLTNRHYQKVTMPTANLAFDRRSIPAEAQESDWQTADGWRIRRIDLNCTGDARGSLLFLPGRGDHYEKYLETLNYFARKGWSVTAIDWRGQGGSGRLLDDPHVGHIDDFSTWISDLRGFWRSWKANTPGPHVIVAHSMGGHLAMRALVEQAVDPDAVALSAPMLGILTLGLPVSWHHAISKFLGSLGNPQRAAWKEGEKPGSPLSARKMILTHDQARYEDEIFWWEKRPFVRLGPPSWHWVERAIASTRMLAEPGRMENVSTPVLLLAAKSDKLVDTKRIINDAARLPNSELMVFGDEAAHELLREADPVRDRCLEAIDHFFDKNAPHQ